MLTIIIIFTIITLVIFQIFESVYIKTKGTPNFLFALIWLPALLVELYSAIIYPFFGIRFTLTILVYKNLDSKSDSKTNESDKH
jgi:hypothetical protein